MACLEASKLKMILMIKIIFMKIHPVVLCGGSGTRLWPLSRKSFPKQFVPLIDGRSLLEMTLRRVAVWDETITLVAAEEHRFMVLDALQMVNHKGLILLEPEGRNTAAAMALAALATAFSNDLLLFCPADHHIPDVDRFRQTIEAGAIAANDGHLVTYGIIPTQPSTGFGYIERGRERADGSWHVTQFIEKPDAVKAQQMLLGGQHLWNAGIILSRADTLIAALEAHAPDILAVCREAMSQATHEPDHGFTRPDPKTFLNCRSQSIDYAVMEHHQQLALVPFAGQWSDVGNWNTAAQLTPPDADNNRIIGQGLAIQSERTYIHAPHRPVVTLGTNNLLVIDTPDALLVAHSDMAEEVKKVVAILEDHQIQQAQTHRRVARPWGWYDGLGQGDLFQVKRITVKPGASLSLQKHHHRAEHWVVVKGTAEVTRDDEVLLLKENQSTYIPLGSAHRLHNPGNAELEIIEIQTGSYLGEDDIVRLDDRYGRSVGQSK
jgi:mannose-1-phosphate guanylyltransferase/mannose-6-phosphate isomerase